MTQGFRPKLVILGHRNPFEDMLASVSQRLIRRSVFANRTVL
jgi:hypothetical protein